MKKLLIGSCIAFALLLPLSALFSGCASVAPGNDPLIVNAERAETTAVSTFDLVLSIDDSARAFWASNAPAFHGFAEYLRTPVPTLDPARTPARRAAAYVIDLNITKNIYRGNRNASNDLLS